MFDELKNLKKSAVGGYNKQSVLDYIKQVAKEFFEYKIYTQSVLKQLNARISVLADEPINPDMSEQQERDFSISEISSSKQQVKEYFEQINAKLDKLIEMRAEETQDSENPLDTSVFISQMISENNEAIEEELNSIDAFFDEFEKLDD
ncbi:MAG: hypothetical protein R3Y27_03810 [Clostridia bacterium]